MATQKLTTADIIYLVVFAILITAGFALKFYPIPGHNPKQDQVIYELSVGFLAFYVITTTPFSNRFRNWFFAVPWLCLCLLFILTDIRPVTCATLVMSVSFYIIRAIFFNSYSREFIPTELTRTFNPRYAYFSKLDNRQSGREDFNYMRLYALIGFVSLMVCIYSSGKRVQHAQPLPNRVEDVRKGS